MSEIMIFLNRFSVFIFCILGALLSIAALMKDCDSFALKFLSLLAMIGWIVSTVYFSYCVLTS